jgi:hypothetical protein
MSAEAHTGQWLVQGNDVANGSLSSHIAGDPHVVELRRIASDVVVLAMPPDRAAGLRARFGNRLVIEPNRDLIPPIS